MSIQNVINQNQQTIAFLEAQDYYSAVVSSSSALQCLSSIVSMQQDMLDQPLSTATNAFDQCMLLTRIQEKDDGFHQPHPFLYDHAIRLPPNVTNHAIITPVLIFNAALAHHLVARRDKARSQQYLQRAKQLYTLAYDAQDIEQNPLFQFVVYNNAALIDLQIGKNTDSWNSNLGYLMSTYMVLVDQGCTSQIRHIQGFLDNLFAAMPSAAAA